MAYTDQDEDISWYIYVGTIVTIVPATIAVGARFFSRHVSRAKFWWDDYTIAVALVFNWAMAIQRWAQISQYGLGYHSHHIALSMVRGYSKSFLALSITYLANAVLTKISILLFYYRIFGVVKNFRWALWVSGFLVVGYFIACTIVSVVGCWPVAKFWDRDLPGSCINQVHFFRWHGVTNMLLDVLILCLPFPMAWRLQVGLKQKFQISGIFLLGSFVCVISILRVTSFDFGSLHDFTYVSVEPSAWSSVEQSVGIICACLPTMRPLFQWLSEKSRHNSKATFSSQNSHSEWFSRQSCGDEEKTVGLADEAHNESLSEARTPTLEILQERNSETLALQRESFA